MTETLQVEQFAEAGRRFSELVALMARLRAPAGCPWDRKQTFDSIKQYTLEETYEVLDAIDARDWPGLCEELGDFMLQAVFYGEMAREQGLFSIDDALKAINEKLVRRHPHIFGDATAETPEAVKLRWDEIKQQEKAAGGKAVAKSILDGVPRTLPALMEAEKLGNKAHSVGFDWPDVEGVMQKFREEAEELAEARRSGDPAYIEHELGDLLFNAVNLARHLGVDPEQALRGTNRRFRQRFGHLEKQMAASNRTLEAAGLEEMEELWQEAKALERST